MPDYNADGDVTQIGLTTIKVQNARDERIRRAAHQTRDPNRHEQC
jgi:hypothetical protein